MKQSGELGFRIRTGLPRTERGLVERFKGAATSNLADAMGRFHFMDPGIRSRTGRSLCGVAVTVNTRSGDNLMVHKALEIAEPGDVIVVSTQGNVTTAVFGELMCRCAVAAGLNGIVVDGAIRDIDGIAALEFPAFSRSVSPGACDKDGPGEVNVPICCGGTVVLPGDVVVGDGDGVVVVQRLDAAEVLERVDALVEREKQRIEEIRNGVLFKPDIDEILRKKGVIE